MKLPGALIFSVLGLTLASALSAADAAKVDYTERNAQFAPAAGINPEKRAPETNATLQDRRIAPAVTAPTTAAVGSRRAAIDLTETREENRLTPDSRRPEAEAPERSRFDHRESRFQPDPAHAGPKMVERYQAALTTANATNQARSPALGAGTTARVNRFVFRRNSAAPASPATDVVSAAGGAGPARP
jgi:hypothetical protein